MGKSLSAEVEVLCATLDSAKHLNNLSLLFSGGCILLLVTDDNPQVLFFAGIGLLIGLVQSYFNWRVRLDVQLLPLLLEQGTECFDQALATIFPDKAKSLTERSFQLRLSGALGLFYRQCVCIGIQLLCSLTAIAIQVFLEVNSNIG